MAHETLNNATAYYYGDLIIRPQDDGSIRITSDKGTIIVRPHTDNSISTNSTFDTIKRVNCIKH
jgi:hypothetical protein